MPANLNGIPPESVIRTWPTPNYVDPVERSWMPVFAGTLQAFTTLMVVTRLALRMRSQAGGLGLDDVCSRYSLYGASVRLTTTQLFLIPGFIFGTAFSALAILSPVDYGSGRHVWDVVPSKFSTIVLIAWLAEIAFVLSTCCTKVSVLLFYRRLAEGSYSRKWRLATLTAIGFTICFCLVLVLMLIFSCNPTSAYWNAYSPTYKGNYKCLDTKLMNPISGALSVFSDFYAVVLPVAMMRRFETNRQKKFALNAIFSLGLLIVVAGIVRTYYLNQLGTANDLIWVGYDLFVWSELETQLALIVASAPALRVFVRQYVGQPISRALRSRQSQSGTRTSGRWSAPLESPTHTRQDSMSDPSMLNDKKVLVNSMKPSLAVLEEHEIDSPASSFNEHTTMSHNAFHSYALQNLNMRPPT